MIIIRVDAINSLDYGFHTTRAEPDPTQIQSCVQGRLLESRGYQEHEKELVAEWSSRGSYEAAANAAREYHARRIAHFIVNGWTDLIIVGRDNWLLEGGHRWRAAKHQAIEFLACLKRDLTKEEYEREQRMREGQDRFGS